MILFWLKILTSKTQIGGGIIFSINGCEWIYFPDGDFIWSEFASSYLSTLLHRYPQVLEWILLEWILVNNEDFESTNVRIGFDGIYFG